PGAVEDRLQAGRAHRVGGRLRHHAVEAVGGRRRVHRHLAARLRRHARRGRRRDDRGLLPPAPAGARGGRPVPARRAVRVQGRLQPGGAGGAGGGHRAQPARLPRRARGGRGGSFVRPHLRVGLVRCVLPGRRRVPGRHEALARGREVERKSRHSMGVDLSIVVNGITFENPFLLASGPPGTNAKVIAKSFDLGWGGVVCKTISLDSSKVINTAPRYGKFKSRQSKEVVGFENIELISDRPFDVWLDELRQLKKSYPNKDLVASIMEEGRREAWHEIVRRVQETGVDAFGMNLSCPHGLPERRMGMAMGEDPERVKEVVGWVKEVARIPVWAKMTPNVGNPADPARKAVEAGADGISAINTIL